MEILTLAGYTLQEKIAIAQRYIVPRQVKEAGLQKKELVIPDDVMEYIILSYTREAGLRKLEQTIASICRKLAHKKALGQPLYTKLTRSVVEELLGAPRYLEEDTDHLPLPGLATGLAWTSVGGEVLQVETNIVKGKGKLLLTGQLGDVMKESAQAAMSYVRLRAKDLKINPDFADENDIHIHVPAGAVPKDGPSAGVTMTASLVSALSGIPTNTDFCMTGEITLRGRVLPVGGIKEKILAGVGKQIHNVIIPKQNVKDLEEIPYDLLTKIKVYPVEHIDEVLPLLFGKRFGKVTVKPVNPKDIHKNKLAQQKEKSQRLGISAKKEESKQNVKKSSVSGSSRGEKKALLHEETATKATKTAKKQQKKEGASSKTDEVPTSASVKKGSSKKVVSTGIKQTQGKTVSGAKQQKEDSSSAMSTARKVRTKKKK